MYEINIDYKVLIKYLFSFVVLLGIFLFFYFTLRLQYAFLNQMLFLIVLALLTIVFFRIYNVRMFIPALIVEPSLIIISIIFYLTNNFEVISYNIVFVSIAFSFITLLFGLINSIIQALINNNIPLLMERHTNKTIQTKKDKTLPIKPRLYWLISMFAFLFFIPSITTNIKTSNLSYEGRFVNVFDQEDMTDLIDLIFEYNAPISLDDIKAELGFSKEKSNAIINLLLEYSIIDLDDNERLIPKINYDNAILLAQSIKTN